MNIFGKSTCIQYTRMQYFYSAQFTYNLARLGQCFRAVGRLDSLLWDRSLKIRKNRMTNYNIMTTVICK